MCPTLAAAVVDTPPDSPPPDLRYRRSLNPVAAVRELWTARLLLWTVAERDFRARYKQAVLGATWAVLTPLALLAVFTLLLQRAARFDTSGTPYPLFAYTALVGWTFFAASLTRGGTSLVTNSALLNKVYCPREVFPLASGVGTAALDTLFALPTLLVLFVAYGHLPGRTAAAVPVLMAIQLAFTIGVVLLLAAFTVYARDLVSVLPVLLQLGLFATPVAYGMSSIPEGLRMPLTLVNPLAPVIDGYRRTLALDAWPEWHLVGLAALVATVWLVVGYVSFKKLETRFADVA